MKRRQFVSRCYQQRIVGRVQFHSLIDSQEFTVQLIMMSLVKPCNPTQTLLGDFQHVWQNACVNSVREVMVWDVYFPFPKIL